jgi:hypothetical protein
LLAGYYLWQTSMVVLAVGATALAITSAFARPLEA